MTRPLDAHKVASARLWAAAHHPYLAAALFAITPVAQEGLGRASVDEWWRLYLDPDVVEEWSIEVLGSVMIHHTGHLLRDHAGRARAQGVDRGTARRWSQAADAEINDDLIGTGVRLPGEPVLPQSLGYLPGQLAEEYYRGRGHDCDVEPDCGSGSDSVTRAFELGGDRGSGLPPGERHLLRCQVASEVLSRARAGQGRVPAAWKRWATDLLEPQVDWRRALAAEIRKGVGTVAGRVDYTYRRLSRRAGVSPDVVLPALERPVPEVVVVVDTSGSMDDGALAQVLAEVDGLLRGLGLARNQVRVMAVDAAVQSVQRAASARHLT
ncbi:MAG: vWA domain-containing protein, partial [Acidimicrobiales bacterium]